MIFRLLLVIFNVAALIEDQKVRRNLNLSIDIAFSPISAKRDLFLDLAVARPPRLAAFCVCIIEYKDVYTVVIT